MSLTDFLGIWCGLGLIAWGLAWIIDCATKSKSGSYWTVADSIISCLVMGPFAFLVLFKGLMALAKKKNDKG